MTNQCTLLTIRCCPIPLPRTLVRNRAGSKAGAEVERGKEVKLTNHLAVQEKSPTFLPTRAMKSFLAKLSGTVFAVSICMASVSLTAQIDGARRPRIGYRGDHAAL